MELDDIETITVLGAGTMGHGIAEVAALAGYDVRLRDIEEEIVQDGYDQIEWSLNKLAEKDIISEEQRDAAIESVTAVVDMEEAVDDADVVIEAIIENMDIKKDVYQELDAAAPDRTIFASNTSSLSITELSEVTDRPEQFCGMHFFNPPVQMDLVEVINGEHTSQETTDLIAELAESMDKTPVHVRKDEPGFIANRILVPLMNEACWLVESDFATIEEVDSTTKYDINIPMGAFELGDQVGNDVILHVLDYMHETLGDAYEPSPLLQRKVDDEELGKKTGKGFYDYDNGGVDIPMDAGREDIEARLTAIMANEVGKLVQKDVAPVEDIDEAVKLGGGFPDGPAKLADKAGLDSLVETLEEAHDETGHARYEPSEGLEEAADDGGFYGGDGDDGDVSFDTIRVEYPSENVGQIVLDRPQQMNTVTPELLDEFAAALDLFEDDDDVRAVLVTGEGDRAFCAGADAVGMAGSANPIDAIELGRKGQQTWGKLEELSMPVVAGIDGYTLGGGMEMATCADLRVATERSTFGQPEHDLGIIPGWGGTQRLKHLIGESRAKEVIFTCDHYDAETMADYGFVNEVVGNDELEEEALGLAEDLAAGPPLAQEYTKKAFLAGRDDTDAGLEVEAQAFGHVIGTEDFLEGVSKMQSDEDPEFEGK
ncbi:3-hydroxyacyl-CoA dehydrogenase/enoyl-CoA hydratase family protein [Salinibaculum salinum]|uniref:3-hydroxyacyl-CoA dehydrogenase/enoyl-CoA hydratase family protein n=1 Tax=Salinibaculum salinum TaxID=3131996 RepID=UPI0030EDDC85